MVSTYTPNIQLEEPGRGDQVGVWDTPVNSNMTLVDKVVGGIATIGLNNSPVVLATAQFQSRQITFNSTLTGSVTITFPSTFVKSYEIQNLCTGSSAFVITLTTTAAGGQAICCPPGETIDCFNDGSNIKFKNLGRVGSYWDHGGSSVPNWVSGCSVPPYLNCDGTAFSSVTYPQLAVILGGTTLPDTRGSARYALNQGTGRLTAAVGGIDGNTKFAAKTTQTTTLVTGNLPAYTPSGSVTTAAGEGGAIGIQNPPQNPLNVVGIGGANSGGSITQPPTFNSFFTGTAQGGLSTPLGVIGTAYIGGITMIRAG